MKTGQLKTKRLCIRPRSLQEMQALRDGETDAALRDAYDEMLARMREQPEQKEWACAWSIALRDGTVVGGIGFRGAPDEEGAVELGYGIDEAHRRQGYAAEAVKAMTEWAALRGAGAVWAQTAPGDAASQGVLGKCGFVPDREGAEYPWFVFRPREAENSGLALGMCLGVSLGMVLGMLLLNNMAVGLSLGLAVGMALGLGWDARRKKKKD